MNMRGKIALVTGASSGIGQATAERLAKAGYKVYGTSRRADTTSQRSFELLSLDVARDEHPVNQSVRKECPCHHASPGGHALARQR